MLTESTHRLVYFKAGESAPLATTLKGSKTLMERVKAACEESYRNHPADVPHTFEVVPC